MSTILAKGSVTVFNQAHTSQVQAPPVHLPAEPVVPTAPAVSLSDNRMQPFNPTSLRQLKLEEPAGRVKRDTATLDITVSAGSDSVRRRYPPIKDAEKADTTLQKNLVHWLSTGKHNGKSIPKNASVTPFIEMYSQALNAPTAQAWFSAQGLKPQTIRIFSDCVVGIVLRDGKETFQRFTTTDGSGWGQVSNTISALQQVLSPSNLGLPAVLGATSIGRDALLDFYREKPPLNEKSAPGVGKQLKHHGWPKIDPTQRDQWASQFQQLTQYREDSAVRTRLAEQLGTQFTGEPDGNVFNLDVQAVVVEPGSSLDRKSKKPRKLFLEFLASATFQAFAKKAGYDLPDSAFRLSEGDLQMRNLAGDWVSLQSAFDVAVGQASRLDDVQGHAARKMNEDFDQLVKMSKGTGNALYSTRTYDARQALAFYTPDVPQNVGQLRAALGWLTVQLPQPPLSGNYASMTPYGQPGLSAKVTETLEGRSAEVELELKEFVTSASGFQTYPDPDRQLAAFFDSPQAIALAEDIAKSIALYAVADGQPLPRAERHQLLATTLKFCANTPVPGKRGTVAGYALYQPENMNRTLKEVRTSAEKHLESKGVDPKVSPLLAHVMMAQSAPEMLVKRDPTVPAEAAGLFNRDPETIKVGSTAWMNLRLGCAIAGDARLNLTQAMALARLGASGPKQEALIKELSVQALLDWAVMSGVFPAPADGKYAVENYMAAAKAFAERESQTQEAFATLVSESPTQTNLLVQQLVLLFPEMTEEEIRNIRLDERRDDDHDVGPVCSVERSKSKELLTDVILMNQREGEPPLGENNRWVEGAFIHPKVSVATFLERLKQLPEIEPLVAPAVDKYIADDRPAQATALKLMFAELPLKQRMALERSPQIQLYSVRQATGDDLEADNQPNSNVAKSRGIHGLLLRYETGETKPKYGYYEVFPNSRSMVERTDLPDELKLGGEVIKGTKPSGPFAYINAKYQKGTPAPFDFEAYRSGATPRAGVSSEVIIEALGEPLKRPLNHTHHRVPNTFASSITAQLVDKVQAYSFDGRRAGRIAYANAPSDLNKRQYPLSTSNVFTFENARMLLSLIPFVGAIADLVEGKTVDGLKGLLIDFASLAATGGWSGLKSLVKGMKMLIPFTSKPFSLAGLKGGASLIRGLFNPLESVPEIFRAPLKGVKAIAKIANGKPTHLGSNIYLPVKVFEQWRWTVGAVESMSGGQSSAPLPGARKGFIGTQEVLAVQKNGAWYAVNPASQKPEGTPLEQFTAVES